MKVILRPIVKDAWSGIIKYRNCHEDISSYFTRTGRLYTGLTDADAERLGNKLNLDLKANSDFWKTFFIRTSGIDMIFETEQAMDELRYLFCKSHKRVKASIFEHKATANFVLVNEEEEARKSNVHNKAKRQSMRELDKMSTEDHRKALRIYGRRSENLAAEVAENRLFEIVEGDPQGFLDKWVNNQARETQYIIERAVAENIIRRNKRQYTYGTETIGYGIEDAIAYMEDPKNQELRITILSEIKGKEKLSKVVEDVEVPEKTDGPSTNTWANSDSDKVMDEEPVSKILSDPKKEKGIIKKTTAK
jgi:hypothetical protein